MRYPHVRGQLCWYVTPMLQVPDRYQVGVPIRDRYIQSVDGLNCYFRPIFCRSERIMATYIPRYIYEGFVIWINPSTDWSHIVISPIILPRVMSHKYDLRRARVSCMISKFECVISLGNSGCVCSVKDSIRHEVYLRGFPCMDYSLCVLVSWIN